MALETLKNVDEINGYQITHLNKPIDKDDYLKLIEDNFIIAGHEKNTLTYRIQSGPVKEVGLNGCQVDEMIAAAKIIIEELNKKFPCRENSLAITKLDEALMWLRWRKENRTARGVEGYDKE